MTQKHGRHKEHELTTELDAVTPPEVWTTTVGYSGNAAVDACDLIVLVDPKLRTRHDPYQYNIEAKSRQGDSGNLCTIFDGANDETGYEELRRFVEFTPRWAVPILVVSFSNRKLIVLDAQWMLHELTDGAEGKLPSDSVELHDVRVTDAGYVRMRKPTLAHWDSARAAPRDAVVLAEKLGIPYDD